MKRKNAGQHSFADYKFDPVGNGQVYWVNQVTKAEGVSPMALTTAPVTADVKTELPTPTPTAAVAAPSPVVAAPVAGVSAPAPATGKRTRRTKAEMEAARAAAQSAGRVPSAAGAEQQQTAGEEGGSFNSTCGTGRDGFILVLGGVIGRGRDKVNAVTIDELFLHYSGEIIAQKISQKVMEEGSSYWDLDPFRRKEFFQIMAKDIASDIGEEFDAEYILVDTLNAMPDVRALIDAIRPYAFAEINAISA